MQEYKYKFTQEEQEDFVHYLMGFYGPKGIYAEFFQSSDNRLYAPFINEKGPVTENEIVDAMNMLLVTDYVWGGGDSQDREITRDIMLAERMGGYTADLEYSNWLLEQDKLGYQVVD